MIRSFGLVIICLASFGFIANSSAKEATPMAEDPVIEAQVMEIAKELRCLVCQNETIAASDAGVAKDLRRQVREMVKEGKNEEEIVSYMEERYGDFIRYRPAFKLSTLVLWLGPALLFFGALTMLYRNLSRKKDKIIDDETLLSEKDQVRVSALLNKEAGEK
ncbi:Cytochrome c heme lyase subunit CcmL [hydrothermal vent metagenome]|uniref:Cytochrome c heme lyase subunit CcmL n=1 Tax=hydrothermal vent metagenome TaxID=652676 RepID=A0A3B0ZZX4_9ZZZZ